MRKIYNRFFKTLVQLRNPICNNTEHDLENMHFIYMLPDLYLSSNFPLYKFSIPVYQCSKNMYFSLRK